MEKEKMAWLLENASAANFMFFDNGRTEEEAKEIASILGEAEKVEMEGFTWYKSRQEGDQEISVAAFYKKKEGDK